ncbi:MAG: Survival of motor neuron-related-splicing factor 30 [Marteilia pararefringens]
MSGAGAASNSSTIQQQQANVAREQMVYFKSQMIEVERQLKEQPDNDELLELKSDLEYGMKIAAELLQTSLVSDSNPNVKDANNPGAVKPNSASDDFSISKAPMIYDWQIGDFCLAPSFATGNQLLPGQITNIYDSQGKLNVAMKDNYSDCSVKFLSSDEVGEFKFQQLQKIAHAEKEQLITNNNKGKSKDDGLAATTNSHPTNSFKKSNHSNIEINGGKKNARKQVRKESAIKQLEALEKQKNQWLSFKTKNSKIMKGRVNNSSIFKTPDSASGHVGRGTLGTGGKPMTENSKPERNRYYF